MQAISSAFEHASRGDRWPEPAGDGAHFHPYAVVLDEIDYGLILVSAGLRVMHCNHSARVAMRVGQLLQIQGGVIKVPDAASHHRLASAVEFATAHARRSMVTLDHDGTRATVSVVPLAHTGDAPGQLVLLVLNKREICSRLCAERLAREHGLTVAETAVLWALVEGLEPRQIAERHGVKLSTVRTQVQAIFLKLGVHGMRDLYVRVATLPPLVSALRLQLS